MNRTKLSVATTLAAADGLLGCALAAYDLAVGHRARYGDLKQAQQRREVG